MAPKTMEDPEFIKRACDCTIEPFSLPEKRENCRPKYSRDRSVSLFDLSGVKVKDECAKRATLSASTDVGNLDKKDKKSKYSKLVHCWKKFKKSITLSGSDKSR